MIVRRHKSRIVVRAESPEDVEAMRAWAEAFRGHVFAFDAPQDGVCILGDLGPAEDVCRAPLNIVHDSTDPRAALVSNLAHTPFDLHGNRYESVEGFWQGLKFPDAALRRAAAALHGHPARDFGASTAWPERFEYNGRETRSGCYEHWTLMWEACLAKFTQHAAARAALLATGERPLCHRTKGRSRTIPAPVMADIWMRIRSGLMRRVVKTDNDEAAG